MNLNQLLEKATMTESFKNEYYDDVESVFEDLRVFCNGYAYKNSIIKFERKDEVVGDYVVFDSCPHYPGIRMHSFESIKEVESHLISEKSLLNIFTGFSVVLHGDRELLYEVWFLDKGIDTKFIKSQQKGFRNEYPEAVVKWLKQ